MSKIKTSPLRGCKITDATKGQVEAVFATLGVVDSDGDVTVKGAFDDGAEVLIGAYNHKSWQDRLPVGKGTIHEVGDEAILKGEFFLTTEAGREHFETVKAMGALQEWSYSLADVEQERGTKDGAQVNFLKRITVDEVSPVIKGAGAGTRTLAAKGKQLDSDLSRRLRDAGRERFGGDDIYVWLDDFELDAAWAVYAVESEENATRYVQVGYTRAEGGSVELAAEEADVQRTTAYTPKGRGLKLSEQAASVLADVGALIERAAGVKTLRQQEGKSIGGQTADLLKELEPALERLREVLTTAPPTDPTDPDVAREMARFERDRASL